MSILLLIGLLVSHYVGDFILQNNRMALEKSKNWWTLAEHVFLYSLCFVWLGRNFTAITFVLHFLTDAVTSRLTAKLWFIDMLNEPDVEIANGAFVGKFNENRHWFFCMVGLDQLIHSITLLLTYWVVK